MIDNLKPYPEYKQSGVTWLIRIPKHWDIVPSKSLFRHRKDKAHADDQMLTASQSHGIISRDAFMAIEGRRVMQVVVGKVILKHVEPNDFVMSMRSFQGGLEWSRIGGAISSAYVMLIPQQGVHSPYYAQLLKCQPYIAALRRTSDLVRDGQALRYANFGQIHLPLPPYDEQAAIVRFLVHAKAKIERAIRGKRKLIALLNEQKQAIIHRAVTRGIDPTVKFRGSGVPWLGDVPEHWDVRRSSYLFDERNERGRIGLPILVVSLRTGVTVGSDVDEDGREKRLIADVTKYKFADKGDIAYNMMRMWQGAVGVVPVPGMVSPAYVVAKPRPGVFSVYFDHLFHTDDCKNEVNRHSRGIVTDRNRLYWDQFKRLLFPLPQYAEQKAIAARIESETSTLNVAIARTEREIGLIREYRTTLTADVVTGRLDVREAAKRIPVVPEVSLTESDPDIDDPEEDDDAVE
jgi:type I restriction enzyme S subunit